VLESDEHATYRRSINLSQLDPHFTLAFWPSDVHSVAKDRTTLIHPL
jgi:homoaconitase/3-isopropylmalate dehydratase large subunit